MIEPSRIPAQRPARRAPRQRRDRARTLARNASLARRHRSVHDGLMFNDDHRYWQDHFDSRRIADRIDELLVSDTIDAHAKAFIESRDMFFLATCDADGPPAVLVQGRRPRLRARRRRPHARVPRVRRQRHVPVARQHPRQAHVGMLFIDFEQPNRLARQRRRDRRRRRSAPRRVRRARRSSCACGRRRCSRTAVGTSTRCSWSSGPPFVPQAAGRAADPGLEAHDVGAGVPAGSRPRPRRPIG